MSVGRIKPYYKVQITDLGAVERALDAVEKSLGSVAAVPVLNGNVVEVTFDASGSQRLEHKLGRKLIGWQVIGKNAAADIWDSQATELKPELFLTLNASGAVTVKLWVF